MMMEQCAAGHSWQVPGQAQQSRVLAVDHVYTAQRVRHHVRGYFTEGVTRVTSLTIGRFPSDQFSALGRGCAKWPGIVMCSCWEFMVCTCQVLPKPNEGRRVLWTTR
jgi:hypothetical protein